MEERTRPGRVLELGAGRLVEVELAPLVLAWEAEFRAAAPVGGACEKRVGRCESVGSFLYKNLSEQASGPRST